MRLHVTLPWTTAWPGAALDAHVLCGCLRRGAIAAMCTVPSTSVEENQVRGGGGGSFGIGDTEELEHDLAAFQ
ncbi:MAG: hypothetical protein ACREOJ_10915 [Gemmatimonadaceae bacterium]